jgi:hypothetical protein
MEEIEEEYEEVMEIVSNFPSLIEKDQITFELYLRATSLVMTRAFGWMVP